MITQLGIIAGEIWHYLDEHEKKGSLSGLMSGLEKPRDTVLMSLGWLAREGHVIVEETGDGLTIELRK